MIDTYMRQTTSACDVTSGNVLLIQALRQQKGWERGGGQVSTLAGMAASGLSCGNPIGRHWVGHFSPPLHEWA